MENSSAPLITCRIYGQLGNQLFQIAAAMGYAWDFDAIPIFPELNNPGWRISYNKDRIFFRLNASTNPRPFLNLYKTPDSEWFSSAKIPFRKDLVIDGYFQSWKHFHHHRDKIEALFAPSTTTLNYLKGKYKDLLQNENTVGIHVRTQSKRTHDAGIHPFWGTPYYQLAIEKFPSNSTFVIFSDRINWAKKHFSKLAKNILFIEGNDGIEDLYLLSWMKHQILCNSSFSWWAAYLNQKANSKILFPKYWKDPNRFTNPPEENFFLPQWTLIDQLTNSPYPSDMFSFDRESQSIDNNN